MKSSRNRISPSYNGGFTLIELLVVIAIIGTLASIVMASVNSARVKARDAQRMAEMKSINNAIQLYIADHGQAPTFDTCGDQSCWGNDRNVADWNELATKLKPYLGTLPSDPCSVRCDDPSKGNYYSYQYRSPGQPNDPNDGYSIWASRLEGKLEPFGFSTTLGGGFGSG